MMHDACNCTAPNGLIRDWCAGCVKIYEEYRENQKKDEKTMSDKTDNRFYREKGLGISEVNSAEVPPHISYGRLPCQPTKIPFEWETIYMDEHSNTCRVKVIGGWIILHIETSEITGDVQVRQTMQFIPDPFHLWEIEE